MSESVMPKVLETTEMSTADAKWITLKKIKYSDAAGKERLWECAERKTRKSSGIDAVAILAILRSKTNAFPLSTVIIEQYRPPIDKFVVELPAGLVDEGETPEETAIRELEEETGYIGDRVLESSSLVVCDPGMTNANMKLIVLSVSLPDHIETPTKKLEPGEFIVSRVVELAKLNDELKGMSAKTTTHKLLIIILDNLAYDKKGFVVDARLSHFASGYDIARRMQEGIFD